MFQIRFYENGAFVTELGGPVHSLSEAIGQIDRLSKGTDAEEIKDFVGVRWMRAGITPCHILVVDEFGFPIKTVQSEQEDL